VTVPCFSKSSEAEQGCFPERHCLTSHNLCINISKLFARSVRGRGGVFLVNAPILFYFWCH